MIKILILILLMLGMARAENVDLIGDYFKAINKINERIELALIDPSVKTIDDLEKNLGLQVVVDGVRVLGGWIPYPLGHSSNKLIVLLSVKAYGQPIGGVYVGLSYRGGYISTDEFIYSNKRDIEIDKLGYGYSAGAMTVIFDGKERKIIPAKREKIETFKSAVK